MNKEQVISLALNSDFGHNLDQSLLSFHKVTITVAADLTPTIRGAWGDVRNYILEVSEDDEDALEDALWANNKLHWLDEE